jgi:RHH-type proline utilization regulon transcriptional repressor/proline dehydrogenase/delta 1-pyrroline-5-carboxylate dehydrogenase
MQELEQSIANEGTQIFNEIKKGQESLFDKQYWLGRMMEWVMKDPGFKVDLFRFVDVLPALVSNEQVAKHIKEYLIQKDRELPQIVGSALKLSSFSFARGLTANAIRKNVSEIAGRFIAGNSIKSAARVLTKLHEEGFTTTIDLLGEKVLSQQESDVYFERYRQVIADLPTIINPDQANVSLKISALTCHLPEEDPEFSVFSAKERILPLLRQARSQKVFINFDLESYQSAEIIYKLFHEIILSDEYKSWPHLGIVVQAYLVKSENYIAMLLEACKARKTPITIRLVKGAYWDYEVVRAQQLGIECPVFKQKAETDHNFERLSKILLDNHHILKPAFGSHNIRSLSHALAYAKKKNIDPSKFEIQMLYGMAEAERKVLRSKNYHVRIYVPIGEMLIGMSYLVRRLLENTSQMGFLKLSHHDRVASDILLAPPLVKNNIQEEILTNFKNQAHLDFTKESERKLFTKNIQDIEQKLPMRIPVIIGGEKYISNFHKEHKSPNNITKIISKIDLADIIAVDKAIKYSQDIFLELNNLGVKTRAEKLVKLADILRHDRYELSALMCHEVGKTWAEADADVIEAIDFCNFYAERALVELETHAVGVTPGEQNHLSYQGRGPTAIIAPWNFPLAIICGMSVAAYVAGNPIIIKPSEQSSATAYYLFERMLKAGFLPQGCHFLPGKGEEVGAYLCEHPQVATICFTGSKAVGLEILQRAYTHIKNQKLIKKVICEMGGKNAIIVDDDADLDEAIAGVIKSAFGYAGQKCSAASRVIILESIRDVFMKRLVEAADSLVMGNSLLPSTELGPVIDTEAYERLQLKIKDLQVDSSSMICHLGESIKGGYFIPPVIVEVKDPQHWLMQEELFGPILAVHVVENLEQALKIANDSFYALTGAFYSRSPHNISLVKQKFNVGNLYINQKCTGAAVNRQPFGGFKMSGTGPKAGGTHYLLSLVDAKATCENTMRRGFTPEVSV